MMPIMKTPLDNDPVPDLRMDDPSCGDGADDLARYLGSLACADDYHVIEVLGGAADGVGAVTELVCFQGAGGGALGPMVRKRIPLESGVGAAYETLWRLQRAGQRFRHLPLIFDCYKTSVELVVVCEHVPGETLLAYAQRRFAALTAGDPAGFARAVFPGLCDAVSELHDATLPPLVHRDLKPQNVIVASRGLFLIDLGIARQVRAGADHDTVHLGTRAYAPPEQYGFGQTDVRSDVYALGRLLEFCMTGAEPTRRRGAGELAPVMGEGLARVMARATALDPAARYASARELRAAFLHEAGVPGAGGAARLVSGGDGVASTAAAGAAVSVDLPPQPASSVPPLRSSASEPMMPRASAGPSRRSAVLASASLQASSDSPVPASRGLRSASAAPARAGSQVPSVPASSGPQPAPALPSPLYLLHAFERRLLDLSAALRAELERVPLALGLIWDFLVVAVVLLVGVGCVNAVIDPIPADAVLPFWFRALEYLVMLMSWFIGAGWLLLDKRPIERVMPAFGGRPWGRDALVVVLVAVATFVATVIARMLLS